MYYNYSIEIYLPLVVSLNISFVLMHLSHSSHPCIRTFFLYYCNNYYLWKNNDVGEKRQWIQSANKEFTSFFFFGSLSHHLHIGKRRILFVLSFHLPEILVSYLEATLRSFENSAALEILELFKLNSWHTTWFRRPENSLLFISCRFITWVVFYKNF